MKKWLLAVVSAMLALGVSVAAEETITQDSGEKTGNINIDYNAGISYVVTIPASVTFTDTQRTAERGLQAANVVLNEGTSLTINVSSRNDFRMKNGDGYIPYSLKVNYVNSPEGNNYDILTVNAGEGSGWVVLNFSTDLDKTHAFFAGNYTDTLTFTVSVS